MSSEIQYSLNVTVKNGSYSTTFTPTGTIDQATSGASSGIKSVTTTATNLDLGDVATNGVIWLRNLDATNFVTWGLNDTGTLKACGKLKPGEVSFFRLIPAINLMLKADTATCKVQFTLLND